MRVYHGSYAKIDRIDLSKCLPHKDFGRGFYATKLREQAESWAKIIGEKHDTQGFVTELEFTETAFAESICKIKRFDRYDDEWLDFVVMNRDRNIAEPAHDFDIVEGPVANDKVQVTLRLYLKGRIGKEKFLDMLSYHEKTHQICFCTANSLQLLDMVDDSDDIFIEMADIGEKIVGKLILDFDFEEERATDIFYASATFTRLAEKNTELYRQPWQKIYALLKAELEASEKKS
ncbi:MAG: DUF3990 domain-containing protein [Prevotellaceae bacterium]|jgi:hypothetical protein|nr:DUF3990 domain-containing protein [Prevotellaceae bacterium]